MSDITNQTLDLVETKNLSDFTYHVAFMHSEFKQEYDDMYMLDLAHALEKHGHQVTILTSAFNENDYKNFCLKDALKVVFSGSWIPNSIFGTLRKSLARFRAIWMSLRLFFFPPKPKPNLVIADVDPIVLPILYCFRMFKTIYINHFPEIRDSDFYHCSMHITPELITAKSLNYADDIIVQTKGLLHVFRRTYPKVKIDPIVLLPCYDIGLWTDDTVDIRRLIPDLPKDYILLVAFGEYRNRTNFKLVLDSLEHLFSFSEDQIKKRIHLVISGSCKGNSIKHRQHYTDLISRVKEKEYASQVTFLKDLPVIYDKTLIKECTAVVHPTRHNLYPGPILAAMSMAKPVITVNCGFPAEVMMHRLTGILVEPDPYKFAKVMVKLASSKTLQRFIGDMSYSHFSASYSFDRLASKLNNIVSKNLNEDEELYLLSN